MAALPVDPVLTATHQLEAQITELAAHIHAATYRLLTLIREFDRREAWADQGLRSCAHWLNWKCGIDRGAGREKVRVAKALESLPQISEAFSEGRVSYSKVRAMTRIATPENEADLLGLRYGTGRIAGGGWGVGEELCGVGGGGIGGLLPGAGERMRIDQRGLSR